MDVKPIINYKTPQYPDKEEALIKTNLLKALPHRWRNNAYTAVVLSSLIFMSLTACSQKEGVKRAGKVPAVQAAPLFAHGEGRGSFGCVSVAPPAFLSEEEAFEVISEEALREGIVLKKEAPTLKDVKVPVTSLSYNPDKNAKTGSQKGDLTLDGYDESKQIAFEFISKDDIYAWTGKDGVRSSVETFEFMDAAGVIAEGMEGRTSNMTVAAFYDPHYKFDAENIQEIIKGSGNDYKVMEDKLREQVKGDLRAQVRDFLTWLKGQGII